MKQPEEGDWLRRQLAIETRAGSISFVQQPIGKLTLGGAALLATYSHFGLWAAIVAVAASLIAGTTLLHAPRFHVPVLFAATWGSVLFGTALGDLDTAEHIAELMQHMDRPTGSAAIWATGGIALMLPLATLLITSIRRIPQSLLARRPFLTLLCSEVVLCALAVGLQTSDLNDAALSCWTAVFVFTPYLWFLPYAVIDLRTRRDTPLMAHLAVQRPFWSPSYLPFGKGLAYLRKHQATNVEALAVTQIKGLKLLLWANLLHVLRMLLGELPVPNVSEALDAFLTGNPFPVALGWAALVVSTARFCLQIAFWAHLFIGIARLAGYRLPRGSWRPLESRTLMDYFNRFHYYFKEILVDFFFTPTFFKTFKRHPRLRMFFATFMAAGFGNALWHFLRDIDLVASVGPEEAIQIYMSYLFYCVVLAIGIGISQVRLSLGVKPPGGIIGRLQSFFFVWSFVVILHVFSDGSRSHGFSERLHFLASLFGVI